MNRIATLQTHGTSLAPNDMELMQIMMSKIKNTEAKCAQLQSQLDVKVNNLVMLVVS